jgi:NADH:ubiquinone oxidoreductase subunit 6 (subunit J)
VNESVSLSKLLVSILFYSLVVASFLQVTRWRYEPAEIVYGSASGIGHLIFNLQGFVVPFEIVSLVLLAAMIGAIFLAKEASK